MGWTMWLREGAGGKLLYGGWTFVTFKVLTGAHSDMPSACLRMEPKGKGRVRFSKKSAVKHQKWSQTLECSRKASVVWLVLCL